MKKYRKWLMGYAGRYNAVYVKIISYKLYFCGFFAISFFDSKYLIEANQGRLTNRKGECRYAGAEKVQFSRW